MALTSVCEKSLPLNSSGSPVAIAEVQSGFVAPLAEIEESLSRQLAMLNRDGFHDDAGASEEGFGCSDTLDEICRFRFPV